VFPASDGGLVLAPLDICVVASVSVVPYPLLYGVPSGWKFRVPRASATVGVGSSVGASESSDGLTAAPADGDWLLPYGVAVGVGSSEIV
jgi:hypothetical protein